jgi:PAS domain S-box-containing protein
VLTAGLIVYALGNRLSRTAGSLGIDRPPTPEEFQLLFEFAPNGVVVVDREGRIALANASMVQMFGYAAEELIGHPIEMLLPDRLRDGHRHLRGGFVEAPKARSMGANRELFGQRGDGTPFPVEVSLNPIATKSGNFVMATIVDISSRRKAQRELADATSERDDLHRRLLRFQEEERLRLAHELHDETGQVLTAVMLEIKNTEQFVDANGLDRFQRLREHLEGLGESLHRVARQLRPTSLDDLGLHAALTILTKDWSAQYAIATDFHCRCDLGDLDEELRTTIYRVVQEALTNVAKHAIGAAVVSILVDRGSGLLRLTIEDNGCGFEPNDPVRFRRANSISGIGLAGMKERVALIGGEFQIESSIGVGTTIFVRVPISQRRAA